MRTKRGVAFLLMALAISSPGGRARAQAAILMEELFGFFGLLNPTGHNAIFFERICAETLVRLRRCAPGELGAVIARYEGIADYDWVAIPLLPYLYSVESISEIPARTDRNTVTSLRDKYHDARLLSLGANVRKGGDLKRGWSQFVGVAYERRVYAFRFETTESQEDALIAWLNTEANRSHFNLFYRNCADFTGTILNRFFPNAFRRSVLPDAGITTPKQITYKLVRYAGKHPEIHLRAFTIPQVPGYRSRSKRNQSIARSLVTRGYVLVLAVISPYLAGAVLTDCLVWGRFPVSVKNAEVLTPQNMDLLTRSDLALQASSDSEDAKNF